MKAAAHGIPGKAQEVIGGKTQGVRNRILTTNGGAHLDRLIRTQRDGNPCCHAVPNRMVFVGEGGTQYDIARQRTCDGHTAARHYVHYH